MIARSRSYNDRLETIIARIGKVIVGAEHGSCDACRMQTIVFRLLGTARSPGESPSVAKSA